MKPVRPRFYLASIHLVLFLTLFIVPASAQEPAAMKGVDSAKVFFDFRDGIPEVAAAHMQMIHETYNQLNAMQKKPAFVVVFMGSSVKLISSNREGFNPENIKSMDELTANISKMVSAGIQFEACLAAAKYFGIDPKTIPAEIKPVDNGWVSEIGYQAQGYSLVPIY